MSCTVTETVRKHDHHGGKDHGGGSNRNPAIAVLLLVALVYPFRCVFTSVCSLLIENLANIPLYLPYRLPLITG